MKLNNKKLQSRESLMRDFRAIGIKGGMNLMVHSSLSAIGWVIGGAPVVVDALLEVLGEKGTLVMPAATPSCADPAFWEDPNIPKEWMPEIRKHLPVFNIAETPTTMGAIPECFRNWEGTLRSDHPLNSVCARGKLARKIVSEHALEVSEGPGTPYEQIYLSNFYILLLGVGFNRCTMLHFAESRSPNRRMTTSKYPLEKNKKKVWVEVQDMANDNSRHFPVIGEQFMKTGKVVLSPIGEASSKFFSAKDLVDFGTSYFN